jgi:cell division protein FtsW
MARKLAFDKLLFVAVVLLLGVGLVMVYSASAFMTRGDARVLLAGTPFLKQLLAATLGLSLMAACMHVDYRHLSRRPAIYGALALAVLLLVTVLFGPMLNGSRRWLFFAGFSFQPSELAKLIVVLYLAYQLEQRSQERDQVRLLVPCGVVIGLLAILVLLEPDFSTMALILMVAAMLLFLGGLAWRWVAGGVALALLVFWAFVLSVPYRLERILTFLSPESDPLDSGFQVLQSLIAIGSGGVTGLGLGQGVQKLHFLPLASSDFIFAILCEELGLVGALAVLLLFAVFAWRGLRAGLRAPDAFGRYLAWGLTSVIVVQALMNISITLNLLPTTGATLPFISYGGSSLVLTLVASGVLLNISQHA